MFDAKSSACTTGAHPLVLKPKKTPIQPNTKMNLLKKTLLLATVGFLASASQVNATVLDFTGVVGGQNYSQNGMQVISGSLATHWGDVGHLDSGIASHSLISGGDFTLNSVNLTPLFGSGEVGRFTAFNNGVALGFVDLPSGFGTYNFGSVFSNIDEFQVSIVQFHISWDDVNFTPSVPDGGSTLALLSLAFVAVAGFRRKFGV